MSYAPYPGGTLLIPSGYGNGSHLFVIVTKKCKDGQHLLFSLSSIKPDVKYDTTCEFAVGEHPFIVKPSFVYYRQPTRLIAVKIAKLVDSGYYVTKEDFDPEQFDRLRAGIDKSPFTSPATSRYYWDNAPF